MLAIYIAHLKHRLVHGPWLWGGLAVMAGLIWGGYVWLRPDAPVAEVPEVLPPDVTLVDKQWHPVWRPDCPFVLGGYGCALATDGKWVAVGARHTNAFSSKRRGVVGLYRGRPELPDHPVDWTEWTLLVPRDGWAGMEFGHRLAMRDGILLVTAGSIHDDANPEAVYVVEWQQALGKWKDTARLTCPQGMGGHGVGLAVLDKNTIAIGAPDGWGHTRAENLPPRPAVCIYERTGDPNEPWRKAEVLRPPRVHPQNQFGFALATDGEGALIVGAPGRQFPTGEIPDGRICIYRRNAKESPQWKLETTLTGLEDESAAFGSVLSFGGGRLVVGAAGDRTAGIPHRLLVYRRIEVDGRLNWQAENMTWNEVLPGRSLGSVAISQDGQWIAGSAQHDATRGPNTGAVFVWRRLADEPSSWVYHGRLMAKQATPDAYFGVPVLFAGGELLIGSSMRGGNSEWEGAVFRWEVPDTP
jgi:hypothetical protein